MKRDAVTLPVLLAALRTFSKTDRIKLLFFTITQIGIGLLDVVGVALIGFLGALSVTGISSTQAGTKTSYILSLMNIQDLSFQNQTAILGICAVLTLVSRTILSLLLNRKLLFFMSSRSAQLSVILIRKILGQSYIHIKHAQPNEVLLKVTSGINAVYLGLIMNMNTLIVDAAMIFLMFIALLTVDHTVAIGSFLLLSGIAYLIHVSISKKTHKLSKDHYSQSLECNNSIFEAVSQYKENYIHNTQSFTLSRVKESRYRLSGTLAELTFLPSISKYIIESLVIVSALLIGAVQFMTKDAVHAVATISIFLAASSRIAPSMIRLQQSIVQIQSNIGIAQPALSDLVRLNFDENMSHQIPQHLWDYEGFIPGLEVEKMEFSYDAHIVPTLTDISLSVKPGETVAIVGPSGSGKSSLADCILGLLVPSTGSIRISGVNPNEAIRRWPGAISYVPQSVYLVNSSIRDNVCLGLPENLVSEQRLELALKNAQLSHIPLYGGKIADFEVGENGSRLSGGQKQRLGLARALYTEPKLLVLDEASSALDGNTEMELVEALKSLKGQVTVILIAHRISSLKHADKVVYLENGRIRAFGTLEEVRAKVTEFDQQFKSEI